MTEHYYVWMAENTSASNEPWKVLADDKEDAKAVVLKRWRAHRYTLGEIHTPEELAEADPWWFDHLKDQRAINERRT